MTEIPGEIHQIWHNFKFSLVSFCQFQDFGLPPRHCLLAVLFSLLAFITSAVFCWNPCLCVFLAGSCLVLPLPFHSHSSLCFIAIQLCVCFSSLPISQPKFFVSCYCHSLQSFMLHVSMFTSSPSFGFGFLVSYFTICFVQHVFNKSRFQFSHCPVCFVCTWVQSPLSSLFPSHQSVPPFSLAPFAFFPLSQNELTKVWTQWARFFFSVVHRFSKVVHFVPLPEPPPP